MYVVLCPPQPETGHAAAAAAGSSGGEAARIPAPIFSDTGGVLATVSLGDSAWLT